jgi:hypothetical protein
MADDGPLININLSDLSKPVTVFVEKVCNAVGMLYEPRHIKLMAKAETEADEIRTLAQIKLSALEQRAMKRLAHQEARKQENIEQITARAAAALPEDAKVQDLSEDWVAHFFKQCDTVSDKEMQSLWARLLCGEATKPGTFSTRTVNFVSALGKEEAKLFTTFCQFVWVLGKLTPLIYEVDNDTYKKHGITFDSLNHLDTIGLISFEPLSEYKLMGYRKTVGVAYYGRGIQIEFRNEDGNEIQIGHAMLTTTGKELAPVCGSTQNEEFYQYVLRNWVEKELILSSAVRR